MKKFSEEDIKARVTDMLKMVALVGFENKSVSTLSGGQQQRVAIARALAMQPDILCFDEPTSALDPELTGEVLKVIRELRDKGRTMIVVTHEMEFARQVSDHVIFMADGVIEEQGAPEDVFGNPQSEILKSFLNGINK
jgi:polar amino acid transport system ATP-binding protein